MPAHSPSFRVPQPARSGWATLFALLALLPSTDITAQQAQALNTTLVGSVQLEEPWSSNGHDSHSHEFFTTTDLYVAGNYAYMGSNDPVLYIVDISDPAAMHPVAKLAMPGPVLDVKVSGQLAVVAIQGAANTKLGVAVVDISDPRDPHILSEFTDEHWFGVHNLYLHQNRAYLAHSANRGLTVLNLEDPTRPFISGTWINDTEKFGSIIHDVFIRDGKAILSDLIRGIGGLVVLDLADPDHPLTLSSLSIPEGLHNAWQEGNYIYCNQELGGWQQQLHIIDIADPRHPVEVGTLKVQRSAINGAIGPHNIWVEDGLLYWAYYNGGLRIFDLADPVHPVEIGYYHTPYAWGAQPHEDGLIYLADARLSAILALRFQAPSYAVQTASLSSSLQIVGDETTIEVKATVASIRPDAGSIRAVTTRLLPDRTADRWTLHDNGAAGDATGGDGLFTGRVTLPADLPSGQYHLEVIVEDDQGLIYPYSDLPLDLLPTTDLTILDEQWPTGVQVLTEHGAEIPSFLASGPIFRGATAGAFSVQSEGVSDWEIHLQFADALDLLGYAKLRFAFHPGDATGRNLSLYLNDTRFGIAGRGSRPAWRVNITQRGWQQVEIPLDRLQQDRTIDSIILTGNLAGTFYLDDMRLIVESVANTLIAEQQTITPQTPTLAQNWPNPFNGETQIGFTLGQNAEVDLVLFNLAGQQVATLDRGWRSAGVHTLRWSGLDDAGHPLASGMYFYRLHTNDLTQTRKLLLLR